MTMVLAPEKKAVVKKPHEPKAAAHGDTGTHDTAADDAPAQPTPPVQDDEVAPQEVAATEVQQAPAEPVSEAVAESADPA